MQDARLWHASKFGSSKEKCKIRVESLLIGLRMRLRQHREPKKVVKLNASDSMVTHTPGPRIMRVRSPLLLTSNSGT